MDSFEVASQFSTILRNLTPQFQLLSKATYFALKNYDKEDYIVPTITSVLEDAKLDLNSKATIFQFIDLLFAESFQNAQKFKNAYIESIKQLLPKYIDSICPKENPANFQSTYESLRRITKSCKRDCLEYEMMFRDSLLTTEDLSALDQGELEILSKSKFAIEDNDDALVKAWKTLLEKKRDSQLQRYKLLNSSQTVEENVDEEQIFNMRLKLDSRQLLSKRQIIARMEDERESHKRSKENIWCVNRNVGSSSRFVSEDEFFENYWTKCQPLSKAEDHEFVRNLQELNEMALKSYKDEQYF